MRRAISVLLAAVVASAAPSKGLEKIVSKFLDPEIRTVTNIDKGGATIKFATYTTDIFGATRCEAEIVSGGKTFTISSYNEILTARTQVNFEGDLGHWTYISKGQDPLECVILFIGDQVSHSLHKKNDIALYRTTAHLWRNILQLPSVEKRKTPSLVPLVEALPTNVDSHRYEKNDYFFGTVRYHTPDGSHPHSIIITKKDNSTNYRIAYNFDKEPGDQRGVVVDLQDSNNDGTIDIMKIGLWGHERMASLNIERQKGSYVQGLSSLPAVSAQEIAQLTAWGQAYFNNLKNQIKG